MNKKFIISITSIWTILLAWTQVAGWLLGLTSMLSKVGYSLLAVPLVCIIYLFVTQNKGSLMFHPTNHFKSIFVSIKRKKFRIFRSFRVCQIGFSILLVLTIVGAVINQPFGWDAYSYRVSRTLQWLQEGKWYWLNSGDSRLDTMGVAQEFQFSLILLFLKSDRLLFLTNFLPFLLFPSLIYMASRFVGASRRWSLIAMWLLPLGYSFALGAGGLQNDGISGLFTVASIVFACLGSRGYMKITWASAFSLIHISLLSAMKLSNGPLCVGLFVFWLWCSRTDLWQILRNKFFIGATSLICATCSIAPVLVVNKIYEGSFSGDSNNRYKCKSEHFIAAPIVNTFYLLTDGLSPNPFAGQMNYLLNQSKDSNSLLSWLISKQEYAKSLRFSSLPYEGAVGPGYPIIIAVPLCLLFTICGRKLKLNIGGMIILVSNLLALIIYMLVMASPASARIASPYFPALIIGIFAYFTSLGRVAGNRTFVPAFISSFIFVATSLVFSTIRPILSSFVINKIDPYTNGSYELHRYCSSTIGKFVENRSDTLYYIVHWGAITHRLYAPYRPVGRSIEVGGTLWSNSPHNGAGYLALTEDGVNARYQMSLKEFVSHIQAEFVDCDTSPPHGAEEFKILLYYVPDLKKLKPPISARTYFDDCTR